jgi:hypothetical protein
MRSSSDWYCEKKVSMSVILVWPECMFYNLTIYCEVRNVNIFLDLTRIIYSLELLSTE